MMKPVSVVGLVCILLSVLLAGCQSPAAGGAAERPVLTQEENDTFVGLQKDGFLRVVASQNIAYMDPGLWSRMDITMKTNFSRALSIYIGPQDESGKCKVYLYDKMTGKKLAHYREGFGFVIDN